MPAITASDCNGKEAPVTESPACVLGTPNGSPPQTPGRAADFGGGGGATFANTMNSRSLTWSQEESNQLMECLPERHPARWSKFWYRLERLMAERGRLVQIPLLILLGVVQVVLMGLLWATVWRFEENEDPREEEKVSRFIEGWWAAWTFTADGGTHAKFFHPEQRFMGGFMTVAGIIYVATVIAFIVDIVKEKMDAVRVGKSQVEEKGHTLILHWTDKTVPLITELCIANESKGGGVIVVLAKESMSVMTTELMRQVPVEMRRGTKVVCRSGNPYVVADLIKVAADRASSVVLLASERSADESDSTTLRCILSLKSLGYRLIGHLVAEVRDIDNEPLLQLVGGRIVETFVSHDVLGRLMLMSVRQFGLSNVYDAILGFEGDEFYMKAWPELEQTAFGDLLARFPQAVPLGILSANGTLALNPNSSYKMRKDDQLIVIAESQDSYRPEPMREVDAGVTPPPEVHEAVSEKILICGWRRDIRDVLKLLDRIVAPMSEVHTMTHCIPVEKRNAQLLEEGLDVKELSNLVLVHHAGNTSVRRRLEMLPLELYSSVLIFADQAYELDTMQADSHSLATLVLIRDIQASRNEKAMCPVTCEILDSRTQCTIKAQKQLNMLSDFVQSNMFIARILAMISQQRHVKMILNELLGATCCTLRITPSRGFVSKGERISFWTVARRVQMRNGILIGYQGRGLTKETKLNPPDKSEPMSWSCLDLAIIKGKRVRKSDCYPECALEALAMKSDMKRTPASYGLSRKLSINQIDRADRALEVVARDAAEVPPSPIESDSEVSSQPPKGGSRRSSAANMDMLAKAVDNTARRRHLTDEGTAEDSSCPPVPKENSVRPLARTASAEMAGRANSHCLLMGRAERSRFGRDLVALGHAICDGTFPNEEWSARHGASAPRPSELKALSPLPHVLAPLLDVLAAGGGDGGAELGTS